MAGRIDALANSELFSVSRFFKNKVGLWKTINAAVSSQNLRRLRRAILTALIHDSARPHNSVVTQHHLEQFNWDVSDHPV
ncbi:hypothetical protein AVEN_255201-1 [Araneus ventricosus]|uniref:Histone-lysine N-methyltransferase SETMAR n=1 Tax=Araneus ventricosus TaxID=182803 RepID=A0A4Y2BA21_ARAVE|nr:hypothetical protein AVEN_255201-1 [Araneus ventricosus]